MPFPPEDTPASPDSTEAAAFADALHRVADDLAPADRRALMSAGFARGRTLRRRRTAAVTAGVAVLALAGGGGLLAATSGNGAGHTAATGTTTGVAAPALQNTASVASTASAPSYTARQVENLLVSMLPHGKISDRLGRGTEDTAPYAQLVFDDGHGPAEVSVVLQTQSDVPQNCAAAHAAGDYCRQTTVHGGTLTIWKGWEYSDHRNNTKEWMAEYRHQDGAQVSVSEWNAPSEKDVPASRPNPPLTAARLASIATAPAWNKVLAVTPDGVTGKK
ncbi:hypothetical protein [Streptomyces sp. CA-111067]|uniref:hypothetical protein n=1 Tax=Streptomyces sp. CA-111067 TaxID=3240046 RepID=UPI003D98CAD3